MWSGKERLVGPYEEALVFVDDDMATSRSLFDWFEKPYIHPPFSLPPEAHPGILHRQINKTARFPRESTHRSTICLPWVYPLPVPCFSYLVFFYRPHSSATKLSYISLRKSPPTPFLTSAASLQRNTSQYGNHRLKDDCEVEETCRPSSLPVR